MDLPSPRFAGFATLSACICAHQNYIWSLWLPFKAHVYALSVANPAERGLVKKLYERIPSQLHIETHLGLSLSSTLSQNVIIREIITDYVRHSNERFIIIIGHPFTINKNELLKSDIRTFYYGGSFGKFHLKPHKYLNENFDQICHSIEFTKHINFHWLSYCATQLNYAKK